MDLDSFCTLKFTATKNRFPRESPLKNDQGTIEGAEENE